MVIEKKPPNERPFKLLGIQQIAIGASDRTPLLHLWNTLLGVPVHSDYRSEAENVVESILLLGDEPNQVEIDLMEPIDPEKSPKVHQPPLNHIGLWVDALPAAVEWLQARGVRFTPGGIRKGAAGYDVCFIHPKGNEQTPYGGQGVLIELVQAPASLISQLNPKAI